MAVGDEYRAKAAEFLPKAHTESDPKRFMELGKLAASYERLANQAERNVQVDLAYESAPPPPTDDRSAEQA
jgi:hypothetical protein